MPTKLVNYRSAWALSAIALLGSLHTAQAAVARTPSISGNGWVALGIIVGLIAGIWFLIQGTLHLERRDATLGRRRRDDGWFGIFPAGRRDDEDAPDFQHDDGGEGN